MRGDSGAIPAEGVLPVRDIGVALEVDGDLWGGSSLDGSEERDGGEDELGREHCGEG